MGTRRRGCRLAESRNDVCDDAWTACAARTPDRVGLGALAVVARTRGAAFDHALRLPTAAVLGWPTSRRCGVHAPPGPVRLPLDNLGCLRCASHSGPSGHGTDGWNSARGAQSFVGPALRPRSVRARSPGASRLGDDGRAASILGGPSRHWGHGGRACVGVVRHRYDVGVGFGRRRGFRHLRHLQAPRA